LESRKGDNVNDNLKEIKIDNFNKGLHRGIMLNEPLGFASVAEKNSWYQQALSLNNDDKIVIIELLNNIGYDLKKVRATS
tara:strand:+ start:221 stop:460 length:240 start_codon:yes stop_codon:yes gene_type:complete